MCERRRETEEHKEIKREREGIVCNSSTSQCEGVFFGYP